MKKALFLCYGNACRSIMAEALARRFLGNCVEAYSAGLIPLGHIPPFTLEVLEETGIPTGGLYSKGFSEVPLGDMDFLVNLTELKVGPLIPPSFSGKLISRPVRDPFGHSIESFRETRERLGRLIRQELPGLIGMEEGCSPDASGAVEFASDDIENGESEAM